MTPEQIRARLKAAGYSETLLDPYLAGGTPVPVSDSAGLFSAVQALGLPAIAPVVQAPLGSSKSISDKDSLTPEKRFFGLDVFQRATSQFDPTLAGVADASYRVGPGDLLVLILTGGVEAAYNLEVTREGFIVVPQVGQIYVANLTMDDIRDLLFARLSRIYSGIARSAAASTHFTVSIGRVRTNQIFVIGEANVPGSYQVSALGTLLTALYAAGGPSASGSLRGVEVRRNGRVVDTFDVYDYLIAGNTTADIRLNNGDVVFIPFHGRRVTIKGQIGRPATYELKQGETLRELIGMAGGFTPSAARRRVQIRRILSPEMRTESGKERVVIDVESDQFVTGLGPSFPLEAGDEIRVFEVGEEVRNKIAVIGNVWHPGPQGLTTGMRLSAALRTAGGIRPDTYLGQLLVTRTHPDGSSEQLRVALHDTSGTVERDIALQENDTVRVFSRNDARPDRTVSVVGAVRKSGTYPFREGMTLKDLILMAGGLEQSAYLAGAEVARLPEDRKAGQLAVTVRVPLDSTYLLEWGPDGKYMGPPGLPALVPTAPDYILKPYDNVLILQQPDWELQRTVRVEGEVRFPGQYTLTSRDERLSALIRRAGGLTDRAFPEGATFVRKYQDIGRIDVDLARAISMPNSRDDFILAAGDEVTVPEVNPVVKISGAVNAQTSVAYLPGAGVGYYLDAAGGLLPNADRSRLFVTQPNGMRQPYRQRWLLPDGSPVPLAGAEIYVPTKPETKTDRAAIAGSIAQVIAGITTVLIVALRR